MDGRRVRGLSTDPSPAATAGPGAGRLGVLADFAVCAGLVTVVIGTFLPWVSSGTADRNVYAAGGLLKRLVGVSGLAAVVLDALPFLALGCAVVVAVIVIGHGAESPWMALAGRVGAVAVALGAIVGSVEALTAHRRYGVAAASLGPGTELVGAIVTVIAASTAFLYRGVRE